MTRPAHADPTLWEHVWWRPSRDAWVDTSRVFISPTTRRHPVAHLIVDFDAPLRSLMEVGDIKHRSMTACGIQYSGFQSPFVLTRWAAQFAVPCLRCWPDAREGREATVAARAKATA